jgi:hypothetical protein
VRPAPAGALAALVWAAVEPLDRRLLRNDYSDVAMLGKLATRTRAWPLAGLAVHAANGAAFGLAYGRLRKRTPVTPLQLALVEHTLLYPLTYVVDRVHPARGTRGLAPSFTPRGFVQETARHVLFGAVLGRLLREERA